MAIATCTYSSAGLNTNGGSGGSVVTVNGCSFSGTTLTLGSTVDFGSITDDGTHIFYADTSAGTRHLFRVTAFTPSVGAATTLTVSQSGSGSGLTIGLGGTRLNPYGDTTRHDALDAEYGWKFVHGTQTYTLPTGVTPIVLPVAGTFSNGGIEFVADTDASPVFDWSETGAACFAPTANSHSIFSGISFTNTTGVAASCIAFSCVLNNITLQLIDCTFVQAGEALFADRIGIYTVTGCDIEATSTSADGVGITLGGSTTLRVGATITANKIHDCTSHGLVLNLQANQCPVTVAGNSIYDNAGTAIYANQAEAFLDVLIAYNTCDGNDVGIELFGTQVQYSGGYMIHSNMLTNNTTAGFEAVASAYVATRLFLDYNSYYANGTAILNITQAGVEGDGLNNVTLTADPYTDRTGKDFTLNNTEGGGAACRGTAKGLT